MSARNARFVLVPLATFLSLACGSAPPASSASQEQALTSSSASLGSASNFAVLSAAPLSGGAVTCTGATINGDVGSSGSAASIVRTGCIINGATVAPVASGVVNDFNSAYAALASQSCTQTINQAAFTDTALSVNPGVICFPAAATFTRTTLTLNGSATDTWLFKVGTSGTGALTGTGFSVVMAGGGNPCNVTWWIAQAVTMTTSNFSGTILAGAAITATVGTAGAFNGRALAKAAVTLTGGTLNGCTGGSIGGGGGDDDGEGDHDHDHDKDHHKCNQGRGNGREGCDPGNSDHHNGSNDEDGHGRGRGH